MLNSQLPHKSNTFTLPILPYYIMTGDTDDICSAWRLFRLPGYWRALAPDFCPHHWRKSSQVFQRPNTPVIRTERPKFSNKDSIFILFVCYIHPSFSSHKETSLIAYEGWPFKQSNTHNTTRFTCKNKKMSIPLYFISFFHMYFVF